MDRCQVFTIVFSFISSESERGGSVNEKSVRLCGPLFLRFVNSVYEGGKVEFRSQNETVLLCGGCDGFG